MLGKTLIGSLTGVLLFSFTIPPQPLSAQTISNTVLNLPVPGSMVPLSSDYQPVTLRGLTVDPNDPFKFDFLVSPGDDAPDSDSLSAESQKLIKYFLAALTIPEDQMWVNLSPYEKDRIIPDGFGATEMGRDLLALDYLLKQLTASLMYPEDELGQAFWTRVRQRAQAEFGTTEIPMNTFNKIWIVPDRANVYVQDQTVVVVDNHLKVMLEEDYLALEHHTAETPGDTDVMTQVNAEIVREILIPEIEREINHGQTFANLRQIYNAVILASWYKNNLQQSFLTRAYADQLKVDGIEQDDVQINQRIYDQYVEAFRKGVYNYIREDVDPATQQPIPRKYFSGGADLSVDVGMVSDLSDTVRSRVISALATVAVITTSLVFTTPPVFSQETATAPNAVVIQRQPLQWPDGSTMLGPERPGITYYNSPSHSFIPLLDIAEGGQGEAARMVAAGFRLIKVYTTGFQNIEEFERVSRRLHEQYGLKFVAVFSPQINGSILRSDAVLDRYIDQYMDHLGRHPWISIQLGNEDHQYLRGELLAPGSTGIPMTLEQYYARYDQIALRMQQRYAQLNPSETTPKPILLGQAIRIGKDDNWLASLEQTTQYVRQMRHISGLAINAYLDPPELYGPVLQYLHERTGMPIVVSEFGRSRVNITADRQLQYNQLAWRQMQASMRAGHASGAILFAWGDKARGDEAAGFSAAHQVYDREFGIRQSVGNGLYFDQTPAQNNVIARSDYSTGDETFWRALGDPRANRDFLVWYSQQLQGPAAEQQRTKTIAIRQAEIRQTTLSDREINSYHALNFMGEALYQLAVIALYDGNLDELERIYDQMYVYYSGAQMYYGPRTFWMPFENIQSQMEIVREVTSDPAVRERLRLIVAARDRNNRGITYQDVSDGRDRAMLTDHGLKPTDKVAMTEGLFLDRTYRTLERFSENLTFAELAQMIRDGSISNVPGLGLKGRTDAHTVVEDLGFLYVRQVVPADSAMLDGATLDLASATHLGRTSFTPEKIERYLQMVGDKSRYEKGDVMVQIERENRPVIEAMHVELMRMIGAEVRDISRKQQVIKKSLNNIYIFTIENLIDAYLLRRETEPGFDEDLYVDFYISYADGAIDLHMVSNANLLDERNAKRRLGGWGEGYQAAKDLARGIQLEAQMQTIDRQTLPEAEVGSIYIMRLDRAHMREYLWLEPDPIDAITQRDDKAMASDAEIQSRLEQRRDVKAIETELEKLVEELGAIIRENRGGITDRKQAELLRRRQIVVDKLRELYRRIPVKVDTNLEYDQYSDKLRELRAEQRSIASRIEREDGSGGKERLAQLNLDAIKNNQRILNLQILIAGRLLTGKTRSGEIHDLPALTTLEGAINSALAMDIEIEYRVQRLKGQQLLSRYQSDRVYGDRLKTYRLGQYHVGLAPSPDNEDDQGVTITQQVAINVHTTLDEIRRQANRGDKSDALKNLARIERLYSDDVKLAREPYKRLREDIRQLRETLEALEQDVVLEKGAARDTVADQVKRLTQNVRFPKQEVATERTYKNDEKAFHGRVRSMASELNTYMTVLKYRTDLRYYAIKLQNAIKQQQRGRAVALSQRNRKIIKARLTEFEEWSRAGHTVMRVDASILFDSILELIDQDEFVQAEAILRRIISQLDQGLQRIERITGHLERQALKYYARHRDQDVTRRVDGIIAAINDQEYTSAANLIDELLQEHFTAPPTTRGYEQAERRLKVLKGIFTRLSRDPGSQMTLAQDEIQTLERVKVDIKDGTAIPGQNRRSTDRAMLAGLDIQSYHINGNVNRTVLEVSGDIKQALNLEYYDEGEQANVYTRDDWDFVLKIFKDNPRGEIFIDNTVEAYELAESSLDQLVPEFVFVEIIDDNGRQQTGIIMRKTSPRNLEVELQEAYLAGDRRLIEDRLHQYVNVMAEMIRRGIFPKDAKFANFGSRDGRVRMNDPGFITEDSDWQDLWDRLEVSWEFLRYSLGDARLAEDFVNMLHNVGLDRKDLDITLGVEELIPIDDIAEEIVASMQDLAMLSDTMIINAPTLNGFSTPAEYATTASETLDQVLEQLALPKEATVLNLGYGVHPLAVRHHRVINVDAQSMDQSYVQLRVFGDLLTVETLQADFFTDGIQGLDGVDQTGVALMYNLGDYVSLYGKSNSHKRNIYSYIAQAYRLIPKSGHVVIIENLPPGGGNELGFLADVEDVLETYFPDMIYRPIHNQNEKLIGYVLEKSDRAMTAGQSDRKGGIDLNPNHIRLQVDGASIHMQVPTTVEGLDVQSIQGLVPVIQNIVPSVNLPLLLGMDPASGDPSEPEPARTSHSVDEANADDRAASLSKSTRPRIQL